MVERIYFEKCVHPSFLCLQLSNSVPIQQIDIPMWSASFHLNDDPKYSHQVRKSRTFLLWVDILPRHPFLLRCTTISRVKYRVNYFPRSWTSQHFICSILTLSSFSAFNSYRCYKNYPNCLKDINFHLSIYLISLWTHGEDLLPWICHSDSSSLQSKYVYLRFWAKHRLLPFNITREPLLILRVQTSLTSYSRFSAPFFFFEKLLVEN